MMQLCQKESYRTQTHKDDPMIKSSAAQRTNEHQANHFLHANCEDSEPADLSSRIEAAKCLERGAIGLRPIAAFAVVTALALLAILVAGGVPSAKGQATDKYSLKSPDGIAFSDFRGYEDWPTVSSARQTDVLKVIVANPAMIKAFKAGVPLNGKAFPDGSMIVKLQWSPKKDTE